MSIFLYFECNNLLTIYAKQWLASAKRQYFFGINYYNNVDSFIDRCATISHIRAGKTYTYHCDGGRMEGRFVNVIIPGERKTLTLCEVEVYAVEPAGTAVRD